MLAMLQYKMAAYKVYGYQADLMRSVHVKDRHFRLGKCKIILSEFCFFVTFKISCYTIGVHLKYSAYPHQPLFHIGGMTPQLCQKVLKLTVTTWAICV